MKINSVYQDIYAYVCKMSKNPIFAKMLNDVEKMDDTVSKHEVN